MVDKEKSNQNIVSSENIINWFKEHTFVRTLLTIILTAFFTAFFTSEFNYNTNQQLSVEEYNRSIRDRQMDNIADIVKQVSKIEQLREKIYWAKFFSDISFINQFNGQFDEEVQQLDDYREQYEEASSEFIAMFHLSILLFDLDQDKAIELYNEFSDKIGFGYDSETIKDKWIQLTSEGMTDVEALDELTEYAEERFSDEFFTLGMQYTNTLAAIVKNPQTN